MSISITDAEAIRKGDAVELPFKLVEESTGDPIDLSTGTVSWELREDIGYDAALTLSDAGVSIINRDDINGEFSIKLETGATDGLDTEVYRERVEFVDNNGDETTWIGEIPFKPDE